MGVDELVRICVNLSANKIGKFCGIPLSACKPKRCRPAGTPPLHTSDRLNIPFLRRQTKLRALVVAVYGNYSFSICASKLWEVVMKETAFHILDQYPGFKETCLKYLCHRYFVCLSEISKVNVENLNSFVS